MALHYRITIDVRELLAMTQPLQPPSTSLASQPPPPTMPPAPSHLSERLVLAQMTLATSRVGLGTPLGAVELCA